MSLTKTNQQLRRELKDLGLGLEQAATDSPRTAEIST